MQGSDEQIQRTVQACMSFLQRHADIATICGRIVRRKHTTRMSNSNVVSISQVKITRDSAHVDVVRLVSDVASWVTEDVISSFFVALSLKPNELSLRRTSEGTQAWVALNSAEAVQVKDVCFVVPVAGRHVHLLFTQEEKQPASDTRTQQHTTEETSESRLIVA